MVPVTVAVDSRAGDIHAVNEDRYVCERELQVYAVLDGEVHDGHAAEVAAAMLRSHLHEHRDLLLGGSEGASMALVEAVEEANRAVFDASSGPRWRGCGTTLTCCAVSGTTLLVAHVGDSRLYHLHERSWRLVTRDHSLLEDMRRNGNEMGLSMNEVMAYHSNVITRALGFAPTVVVDVSSVALSSGDLVLLCTDGAWRPFDSQLAGDPPPGLEVGTLLQKIFQRYTLAGEHDNATVLLLSF